MNDAAPAPRRPPVDGPPRAAPARARLPYDPVAAELALKRAGYVHAAHLARQEPLAASWLIPHALAAGPGVAPGDARALDLLWRLLRLAAALASPVHYAGVGDENDDRDPTLTDAVALLLAERAVAPDDLPRFAAALRRAGLDGMAAAVAAARPPG